MSYHLSERDAAWDSIGTPHPSSVEWNHVATCFDRATAQAKRDAKRAQMGNRVNGVKVDWCVRPCRYCGRFYVDKNKERRGDVAGQKRRSRARKKAALAQEAALLREVLTEYLREVLAA